MSKVDAYGSATARRVPKPYNSTRPQSRCSRVGTSLRVGAALGERPQAADPASTERVGAHAPPRQAGRPPDARPEAYVCFGWSEHRTFAARDWCSARAYTGSDDEALRASLKRSGAKRVGGDCSADFGDDARSNRWSSSEYRPSRALAGRTARTDAKEGFRSARIVSRRSISTDPELRKSKVQSRRLRNLGAPAPESDGPLRP